MKENNCWKENIDGLSTVFQIKDTQNNGTYVDIKFYAHYIASEQWILRYNTDKRLTEYATIQ